MNKILEETIEAEVISAMERLEKIFDGKHEIIVIAIADDDDAENGKMTFASTNFCCSTHLAGALSRIAVKLVLSDMEDEERAGLH